jgi:type III secretory pathway component EscU
MDINLISDIVGGVGVTLVILSFFLLQVGKMRAESMTYLMFNLLGAIMLLFSLYYNWNSASVVIEILWFTISLYGIIKVKFIKNNRLNKD